MSSLWSQSSSIQEVRLDDIHGWSREELESILKKALAGDDDAYGLVNLLLDESLNEPIVTMLEFAGKSTVLDERNESAGILYDVLGDTLIAGFDAYIEVPWRREEMRSRAMLDYLLKCQGITEPLH